MNTKTYNVTFHKRIRVGKTTPYVTAKFKLIPVENPLNEHDTAAILFATEFAVNNHSEVAVRLHINEEPI